MGEIVLYRRGTAFYRDPAPDAEEVRLILAPGVLIDTSPYSGEERFYRLEGTVGLDLQTALDAGWCYLAAEGGVAAA